MATFNGTSTKAADIRTWPGDVNDGEDQNDGAGANLRVYHDSVNNRTYRSLVYFDLSSIPTTATVTSCTITLQAIGTEAGSMTLAAYKLLRDWGEGNKQLVAADTGEVTWDSAKHGQDTWGTSGADNTTTDRESAAMATKAISADGDWVMEPTLSVIQDWVENPSTNFGFIVRHNQPAGTNYIYFGTDDNTGNEPTITVEYTEAGGASQRTTLGVG